MDVMQSAATGVVFVLAGAVKGVTGMGLPTVAVSLLGLWMAPVEAAMLLVVPTLATNIAQCRGPHWRVLARRLWPAWLALALATWLLPAPGSAAHARTLLGAVLLVYGAWGLARPALPDLSRASPAVTGAGGALVGAVTGGVAAATAVFVMPLVPFLQSLRLDKDATVQALGLSFTVATLALALRLQSGGDAQWWSPGVALACAGAFAGLGLGAWLRARMSPAAFQRGLFLVFLALGAANLVR